MRSNQRNNKRFALKAVSAAVLTAAFAYSPQALAACPDGWDASKVYTGGNQVSYQGITYSAKWWTQGEAPGGSEWGVWAKGAVCDPQPPTPTPPTPTPPTPTPPTPTPPTPTPPGSCQAAAWDPSKVYTGGQQVSYQGQTYSAKWWTQGEAPSGGEWSVWGKGTVCDPQPPTPPTPTPPTPTPPTPPTPTPPTPTPPTPPTPTPPTPTPPPSGGMEVGSYFAQWGVYGRGFELADVVSNGSAAKLTFINYAFGNIYEKNGGYECGVGIDKLEPGATNPKTPGAGSGGDAWADYGRTPARMIDPSKPIKWDSPLAGNFHELAALKAKFPNIKVFISLGGWTWSKWFSVASKTDALRKQLVSSCLDIYIKGNLPSYSGRGGPGVMKDVFDGIDVDWEFPGGGGQPYNTVSPADKENFTLLMAEFRSQLNALSAANGGKKYYLTAAMSPGKDKIDNTDPGKYAQYFDFVNLMTYDFHGGWEYTSKSYMDGAGENNSNPDAKTDFQSNLYPDPASPNYLDPKTGQRSVVSYYNVDEAVKLLVAAGLPANKIILGIPFYGRGWSGVPNVNNGLYQQATTPARGTYENGVEDYKVLVNAPGTIYVHPVTKQSWKFDGSTFWSYDTTDVIQTKIDYAKQQGLGGAFSWSLDGDDRSATLMNAMSKIRQ